MQRPNEDNRSAAMNQYDLYCQVARDTYQNQNNRRTDFGRRAINISSFSIALIVTSALILSVSSATDGTLSLGATSFWIFIAVLAMSVCIAMCSALTLWPVEWQVAPRPDELKEHVDNDVDRYEDDGIAVWTGGEYTRSVQANRSKLNRISWYINVSLLCLIIQALLLAALPFSLF